MLMDAEFEACLGPDAFQPRLLEQQGLLTAEAKGRGSAWFIRVCERSCVLRHYFRGGLVGRMTRDQFVWNGLVKTRAWQEWKLLAWMFDQGLPVPRPLAAAVHRSGVFYTCDIITHELKGTMTLADHLAEQSLDSSSWAEVGKTIARFHQAGVYHSDLNARNILLDEAGGVHLIDFDKSWVRKPAKKWQQANLERLLRSLNKFSNQQPGFHFSETDWLALTSGYEVFQRA